MVGRLRPDLLLWHLLNALASSILNANILFCRNLHSVGRIETAPDDGMDYFNVVLEAGKDAVTPNLVGQILRRPQMAAGFVRWSKSHT